MRESIGAIVFYERRTARGQEYLAQWNAGWKAFHFVGGHQRAEETSLNCAIRESNEELELAADQFQIDPIPIGRLKYQSFSQRAQMETAYQTTLFSGHLPQKSQQLIERNSQNVWVTPTEIQQGRTKTGQAISPTSALLLQKTGRLSCERDPHVQTIGVTGHRDLHPDQIPDLQVRLHNLFDDADQIADGRSLHLLSPLAAGADQLVAEMGLARDCRLIAPLPFRLEQYEQDFTDHQLTRFHHLLEQAQEWFSMPERHESNEKTLNPEASKYAAVGRYVVDHSDLLIALWDGQRNHKRGGTEATLQYAIQKNQNNGSPIKIGLFPVERSRK
ncbi:NUDIX domain-containing protein [uncultured Rubinisphaera sp.]|uniref:NUDIX domain-containing protein n=1 Tax=uncultured Rubinisphaera sp. TaxID=1678686 RepID=UPI0030DAC20C